jgi:hypothetical protein
VAPGRTAHRPGLPVLGPGPRPRAGPGHLLQGLATATPAAAAPKTNRVRTLPGRAGAATWASTSAAIARFPVCGALWLRPDRIRWSNRDNDAQNWWIWTRSRSRAFTA